MLSNQSLDKVHSVNQSLFTSAMGAGSMKMHAKIGVQQNQFNRAKAMPQAPSRAGPQGSAVTMSAAQNDHFGQIQQNGAEIFGNISKSLQNMVNNAELVIIDNFAPQNN